MQDNYNDDTVIETSDGEHVNPDGETDAQKGARGGGIAGAVTGAVAGSMLGPGGALLGAAVGGLVGAVASGAAVSLVDRVDNDSATDHNAVPVDPIPESVAGWNNTNDTLGNGVPGVQTGGYANDGTPDTRGMMEKTADAITGDNIDDKTGKVVDDTTSMPERGGNWDTTRGYNDPVLPADTVGNGLPGVQAGGYANDGTPDTRGIMEKTADAITGDTVDDKTGKIVNHDNDINDRYDLDEPVGNGVPGIQTGGHATDGTPDTRGITEKTADALTGDTIDDKTGKRVA